MAKARLRKGMRWLSVVKDSGSIQTLSDSVIAKLALHILDESAFQVLETKQGAAIPCGMCQKQPIYTSGCEEYLGEPVPHPISGRLAKEAEKKEEIKSQKGCYP